MGMYTDVGVRVRIQKVDRERLLAWPETTRKDQLICHVAPRDGTLELRACIKNYGGDIESMLEHLEQFIHPDVPSGTIWAVTWYEEADFPEFYTVKRDG